MRRREPVRDDARNRRGHRVAQAADRDRGARQRAGDRRARRRCTAAACSTARTATAGKSAISRWRCTAKARRATDCRSSSPRGRATSCSAPTARASLDEDQRGAAEPQRHRGRRGTQSRGSKAPTGCWSASCSRRGRASERRALFFTTGQHQQSPLAVRLGCEFNDKGTVRTGKYETHPPAGTFRRRRRLSRGPMGGGRGIRRGGGRLRDQHRSDQGRSGLARGAASPTPNFPLPTSKRSDPGRPPPVCERSALGVREFGVGDGARRQVERFLQYLASPCQE